MENIEHVEPRWLKTTDASIFLGVSPDMMFRWRRAEKGPSWIRIEGTRMIRYYIEDLQKFMEGNRDDSEE